MPEMFLTTCVVPIMLCHRGKHHKAYAENANKQLAQSPELAQVSAHA